MVLNCPLRHLTTFAHVWGQINFYIVTSTTTNVDSNAPENLLTNSFDGFLTKRVGWISLTKVISDSACDLAGYYLSQLIQSDDTPSPYRYSDNYQFCFKRIYSGSPWTSWWFWGICSSSNCGSIHSRKYTCTLASTQKCYYLPLSRMNVVDMFLDIRLKHIVEIHSSNYAQSLTHCNALLPLFILGFLVQPGIGGGITHTAIKSLIMHFGRCPLAQL